MNTIHKPGDLEPKPGSATSLALEKHKSRRSLWSYLWESLFSRVGNPGEPRVWFERDRTGESWWCAHDPVSGDRVRCHTGTELRAWLEDRYNRPASAPHIPVTPPFHRW